MFLGTRLPIVISLAAAAALAFALTAAPPASAEEESHGKELFTRYCGACHGPNGTGDGVLSGSLKDKPKNLTLIAKNAGGTFPTQKVMRFIDGTTDVRAHGNPDMPVWGEVFKEQLADSPAQQAEIRKTIIEITDYIASIQAK
jgi:mono/diheme cytochrome c family protein